ncbi:MAG: MBOAT family O-acyltransferase [Chitinophagaceae bacterium]
MSVSRSTSDLTGFSDVGIGLGKMVGLRYQENFRRPYTADSIREFWRRWNVTLVTWLRDYAALPIAGHEQASVGRYGLTIFGFLLIGLWTETSWNVLPWAIYSASWLAIEALGVGVLLQRVPRALRHVYVLLVVLVGWVILRASGPGPLLGYVEAMLGSAVAPFGGSGEYLTPGFVTAFVCAVIFAGPLVSNLSRWRVSVDSAVASLLMMFAATGILLWHLARGIRRLYDVLSGTKRTG